MRRSRSHHRTAHPGTLQSRFFMLLSVLARLRTWRPRFEQGFLHALAWPQYTLRARPCRVLQPPPTTQTTVRASSMRSDHAGCTSSPYTCNHCPRTVANPWRLPPQPPPEVGKRELPPNGLLASPPSAYITVTRNELTEHNPPPVLVISLFAT
jgi:hypothetical protein